MKTTSLSIASAILVLGAGIARAEQPTDPAEEPAPFPAAEPAPAPMPEPLPPPAPEPAAQQAGYDGGFYIHGDDEDLFSLKINGRVQGLFEVDSVEDAAGDRDTEARFSIPRARLKLGGHAHSKAIKYKFQADFGKGFVTLKDFYIDYDRGPARLRVGQWKRPFSRQEINSSGNLELVDRAITNSYFGAGRDIGLAVHNGYDKAPDGLGWIVGLFNGTGEKPWFSGSGTVDPATGEVDVDSGKFTNVPGTFEPALVARVDLNRNGIKGFSEADLEGGPLRWAVGGSVLSEFDADSDDDSSIRGELDYIVKAEGFSTTGGVYVATAQDGGSFTDQSYAATGVYVQAGYVLGDIYQPAVRYAVIIPDVGDNQHEIRAGFSIYLFGHSFKWQTDVGAIITGDNEEPQLRSQLQLAF